MLVAGAIAFGLSRLDHGLTFDLPGGAVIAVLVALCGPVIAGAGLRQFARAGTTTNPHSPGKASALVDGGIYRITRNPMYLGMVFLLTGWGIGLGDLVALVVGPAFFVAVITRLQIIPEERVLAATFGEEYEAFRSRTRRWI